MLISAVAALALFAAPDATQSGGSAPEAKVEARKECYTTTPPGSRLPKKVCVVKALKSAEKPAEASAQPQPQDQAAVQKSDAPKPE